MVSGPSSAPSSSGSRRARLVAQYFVYDFRRRLTDTLYHDGTAARFV
jgi:hypothetical protein